MQVLQAALPRPACDPPSLLQCITMHIFSVDISVFEVHLTKSEVRNLYLSLVVDRHSISMLESNVSHALVIFEGYT